MNPQPPYSVFDAAEQRLEISLRPGAASMLQAAESRWLDAVARSGARALSHCRSDGARAWLLSESSLIVRPERMILITCGRTRVARAALSILEWLPPGDMVALILERRASRIFPLWEPEMEEDACALFSALGGSPAGAASVRGELPGGGAQWRWSLRTASAERTVEIELRGLAPAAAARFSRAGADCVPARGPAEFLLDAVMPGAVIDEHFFSPAGYSLNALRGDSYLTLHLAPQPEFSALTLESNRVEAAAKMLELLRAEFSPAGWRLSRYDGRVAGATESAGTTAPGGEAANTGSGNSARRLGPDTSPSSRNSQATAPPAEWESEAGQLAGSGAETRSNR